MTARPPLDAVRRAARLSAFAGLATLLIALSMGADPLVMPAIDPPCPQPAPILCAELPPDGATLRAVLAAPENPPSRWRIQLALDVVFLVAYGVFGAAGALALGARGVAPRWAAGLFVLAAALDLVEDLALFAAIDTPGVHDRWALLIRATASAKFISLALALLAIAVAAPPGRHRAGGPRWAPWGWTLGAALAIAGCAGLVIPAAWPLSILGLCAGWSALWRAAWRTAHA
jgi:hypothetical protein